MWQLLNRTPYAAERCFVRDLSGREMWLVVVKGTFHIGQDGKTTPENPQPPVTTVPVYYGIPGKSSLVSDTDLVLTKPGTDVLISGKAYAPKGKPTHRVEVGIRCGPIAKMLVVHGDRTYQRGVVGIVPSNASPFVEMPIQYERAFGGVPANPVGVGFCARPENALGRPVPNIESPEHPIGSAKDRPPPAGFGPIARDWQSRVALAGTYDDAWRRDRAPLYPDDFDNRFFFTAPVDQQVPGHLREGSRVELLNLTPEGLLSFDLPRIRPSFRTRFGPEAVEHRAKLHTVVLEPDKRRVSLVWHTSVFAQGKDHRLEGTQIWEKRYV